MEKKTGFGLIQIYTGRGKGKTTAALGLAMRAAGHGFKVAIVHFMKIWNYGEVKSLEKLGIDLFRYGTTELIDPKNPSSIDFEQANKAIEKAEELVENGNYDILILDEINVAVDFNLIPLKRVVDLLDKKPDNLELVITGRNCPKELIERADLVSIIDEIKHPYNKGLEARKGIEF
ncbi:MAG: cob(I)yrinic acid a,c-diamide adenosyltransferase [Deltaproteobacteria bacterium]|nr:cob(I)yrinic acid a,c-diamide adenosyltransferase [Deltaproteobacteria bacterium]MBW1909376.1 cob(I)yrinic acid a,c-diamide adenosyltransferase [Deltaproteobacteria bacterium]MBW2033810.1 cob(I)yrinic acid a,c-diamide adenosyltransferase [Deltaproteobacteria bacterium]